MLRYQLLCFTTISWRGVPGYYIPLFKKSWRGVFRDMQWKAMGKRANASYQPSFPGDDIATDVTQHCTICVEEKGNIRRMKQHIKSIRCMIYPPLHEKLQSRNTLCKTLGGLMNGKRWTGFIRLIIYGLYFCYVYERIKWNQRPPFQSQPFLQVMRVEGRYYF